ncbi:MAG: MarR family winged helix-turn-helix transcriptional regulator [Gammaproteobacteria bacterium]
MRHITENSATIPEVARSPISDADYHKLAAFRASLRKFLRASEEIVQAAGFTPQQHQALLAIKGFEGPGKPLIKDLATQLQIGHGGTVGLVNRLATRGFVRRVPSKLDRRGVNLALTRKGESMLRHLTQAHRIELGQMGKAIKHLLSELTD